MVGETKSMISFRKCDSFNVISLSCVKCDKLLFVILLGVVWSINKSSSLYQQDHNPKQHSYGGQFVGKKEAETKAVEANIRLERIPCNFTNCIYAERKKLHLPIKEFLYRNQRDSTAMMISFVSHSSAINATENNFRANNSSGNSININNVREKAPNDFYKFNWIFEFLACMMLASAFEICFLLLRNLRSISFTFYSFCSTLNTIFKSFCYNYNSTTTSSPKSEQQRKRNVAIGEKRTLSYIFAILTWRASQTNKGGTITAEENVCSETSENAISYGHVTTMGDLLLLILFTHVYYQRQRFNENIVNGGYCDSERLLRINKEKDQRSGAFKKFYDKQNNKDNKSAFNEQRTHRYASNNRCSHFCGNMYQQMSSSLRDRKTSQTKIATETSCTSKIPYLTYCSGFIWYNCCLCQYSCRSCYNSCSNRRRCNQRSHSYIPLCNNIYCCGFYKGLKSFHDINYQHCCYLCCWHDNCYISQFGKNSIYHCCHCNCYCCFCGTLVNMTPARTVNSLLLKKIKGPSLNLYTPTTDEYCVWKLVWNNESYSLLYQIEVQNYSWLHIPSDKSVFFYNRNCYQIAVDIFSYVLPKYLFNIKDCQTFLKWKRLHVAVVVMALIVICTCSGRVNRNQHHYYSSLLDRCNKHISKCRQSKRKRRRRRRRHQHCKVYRPQHYFHTTLIQCVKKQKTRKLPKNFLNKLHKKSIKLLRPTTTIYEQSLNSTATLPKLPIVRGIRRVRGTNPNIVWLLIGLIWFEGPKIINCNVIINYQNQQQHEQQQQQQAGWNINKETTTTTANRVNSNFEYKFEIFNQMKTKHNNNNNNSNNSNSNKNKNKSHSNNNNNNSNNSTNNSSASSGNNNNIQLSVNVIPIINTIHFKHYCNSNYHQKLIRSSQRVQRALKPNRNLDTIITSSASPNYNIVNDDWDSDYMPSSLFQSLNEESHAQSDLMRLESIKHQILFKLGLTRKPNVSHPLPKQFIWDTIYRADGIKSLHEFSNTNNFQDHQQFTSPQNYPYWPSKASTTDPLNTYQQRQDAGDNIKRSLQSTYVAHNKYEHNSRQQLKKQRQQIHSKHYTNDRNGGTISSSKNLNHLLYTTSRNKLISHTNKTVSNLPILKQSKHHLAYKNSPHSTTIISGQKPLIHQQQQQINQHTNNKNINNNNNNNDNYNYNNDDDVNNSNNNKNHNNNIIMVQKHLQNNNKYIKEANKFTYLTDINSNNHNLNIMEEHKNPKSDSNNSIMRKKNPHEYNPFGHDNDRTHTKPLQMQGKNGAALNEKTVENYQRLNFDGIEDTDAVPAEADLIKENDDEKSDQYYQYNQHQHRHDRYFSKLNAFDENEEFFGSTQEIITFAEKGKMYKNHRLVEFSHQNNEKPKQKLHVRYAEIHIRIDKISLKHKPRTGSSIKRTRLKIWIFQLVENNHTYKGFDHVAKFCASFEVDTSRLGWKKFNITTTVKEWYARRKGEKLRLLIDCTGCGKMYTVHLFNGNNIKGYVSSRERRIADEMLHANVNDINNKHFYNVTRNSNEFRNLKLNQTLVGTEDDEVDLRSVINSKNSDDEDMLNFSRPFLVLHTEASRQRRVRRRAINCNGALHGQCCKESFYVSFKALGWDDWIIAPRGYFANYCRGDCTGPYRTPDTFQTFHAHFIEEYRKMGLLNGMQPCCAPIKFSSMSLIYYGDEGIIKRDLPKMVVDECGCP